MRTLPSLILGVSVLLAAPAVFAQTDLERATARDAANNGRAAFDAGKFDKAFDYFSRAEQLVHAPPHLLYMARAQAKLGKLVAAHETYLKISRENLPPNAPKAFIAAQASAEEERDAVDARLPSVTVTLLGAKGSDIVVQMDGTPLPAAMVGIPLPADPGEHTFETTGVSAKSEPVTIKLAEAAKQTVTLTLRSTGVAAPPLAAAAHPPANSAVIPVSEPPRSEGAHTNDAPSKGAGLKVASIVSFGVGAVGLGLGSFFLLESSNTRNESDKIDSECKVMSPTGKCNNPIKQDQIYSKDNDADSQRKLGIVSMIGGGVAVLAGVAFLIADASTGNATAQHVTPHVTPVFGFRSLGLVGTF